MLHGYTGMGAPIHYCLLHCYCNRIKVKIACLHGNIFITENDGMEVNVQDEGQTGIQEVTGPIPMEEKIYAVRHYIWEISNKLLLGVHLTVGHHGSPSDITHKTKYR